MLDFADYDVYINILFVESLDLALNVFLENFVLIRNLSSVLLGNHSARAILIYNINAKVKCYSQLTRSRLSF